MQVSHNIRGRRWQGVGPTAHLTAEAGPDPVMARARRVLVLRDRGMTVRQIAYLTGMPRSTVGDICKRDRDSMPAPAPFWQLVDFQ